MDLRFCIHSWPCPEVEGSWRFECDEAIVIVSDYIWVSIFFFLQGLLRCRLTGGLIPGTGEAGGRRPWCCKEKVTKEAWNSD